MLLRAAGLSSAWRLLQLQNPPIGAANASALPLLCSVDDVCTLPLQLSAEFLDSKEIQSAQMRTKVNRKK
jgi:hypothetical protein